MDWKKPLLLVGLVAAACFASAEFTLTVVHTNDFHGRVEPAVRDNVALGGYARQATLLKRLRQEVPDLLLLNAGDVFQGTLYFNVYEGLADLAFMNKVGYQAMAVGNHEFDRGPAALGTFGRLAKFPVLAANLDVSQEPTLKDVVKASTFVLIGGEKIGIVGAVTEDLPTISNIGPNVKMKPLVASVQAEVDRLKSEGIDKIILLSHCGYTDDQENAPRWRDIDLIVGGHSHSYLGDLTVPGARSMGKYPTIVKDASGSDVYIVQAWEWGKIVGRIDLTFDDNGKVIAFKGAPIMVDSSLPLDPDIESMVQAFAKPLAQLRSQRIGESRARLNRNMTPESDSLMGNVIADAMLESTKKEGAVAAFMNAGGVRSDMEPGVVTFGAAVEVQPFNNTLVVLDLTGAEIKAALEHGVRTLPQFSGALLYPSAGTSYQVDAKKPVGERVTSVTLAGKPLDPKRVYRIAFNSFTAGGGDAHEVLKAAKGARRDLGTFDIDALTAYIKAKTPLAAPTGRRIVIKP